MKSIHLIFISIVAAPAWADPSFPLALFAKVNSTLVRLSGTTFSEDASKLSFLSYGNSVDTCIEIARLYSYLITKETSTLGFVGLHDGLIVFGPTIAPAILRIGNDSKVATGTLYSCEIRDTQVRGILSGSTTIPHKNCSEVELYLLRADGKNQSSLDSAVYERDKNLFTENERIQKGAHDERDGPDTESFFPDTESFFPDNGTFISNNGTFIPNNGTFIPANGTIFPDNKTFPSHTKERLLDFRKQNPNSTPNKPEVDGKHVRAHNMSTKLRFCHHVLDLPWVFFAEDNDVLVPLSNEPFELVSTNNEVFLNVNSKRPPVKFSFQEDYFVTRRTNPKDPSGLYRDLFDISISIKRKCLKFNHKGKLRRYAFYSCISPYGIVLGIGLRGKPTKYCLKMPIYLFKYDEETGTAVRDVSELEFHEINQSVSCVVNGLDSGDANPNIASNVSQPASAGKFDFKADHVDEHTSNSTSRHRKDVHASAFSSFASDPPFAFFAKENDTLYPLFAVSLKTNYVKSSAMAYGQSTSIPVKFVLRDGYAYTTDTSKLRAAGFVRDIFIIGTTTTKASLKFSSDSQGLKGPFYACSMFDPSVRVIMRGTESPSPENCLDVEVYVLPYSPKPQPVEMSLSGYERVSKKHIPGRV